MTAFPKSSEHAESDETQESQNVEQLFKSIEDAESYPNDVPKINLSHLIRRIARSMKNTKKDSYPDVTGERMKGEQQAVSPTPQQSPQKETSSGNAPVQNISIKVEGIEMPKLSGQSFKIGSLEGRGDVNPVDLVYPLIPKNPQRGEPIFAYAKVYWDSNTNSHIYDLRQPAMSEKMKEIYQKVKEMLEQRLDVDFSKLKKIEAKQFLSSHIDEILRYFNLTISQNEKRILKYYMERDFTGLDVIEPLMQDPNIEDISCDGIGIPIFIFHRNPDVGSIMTNVSFNSAEELDSFIIRLAQLSGKSISVAQPLLDGSLPDGSRIQSTLGTDIARRGSNFTIRKFTEEPLTPVHLMNYGTVDSKILSYLWLTIDYGRSILVSGGTASGKTSLLNVLSLFIRPDKKIVSIEDTAELKLPHPHWVPSVARTSISVEGKSEVDLFELLRESLRQRPDYIIVGEVRGKEAYILFQQISTGHPSLATIHSENMERLVNRLTTPPISLPGGLISSLDIVVFIARLRYKNKFVRKIVQVIEIIDFDEKNNVPVYNIVYKWDPKTDKFMVVNNSIALKKISEYFGIKETEIQREIERRMAIIDWMKDNNITDYRDVHKIFLLYYTEPERVLSIIQGAG